MLTAKKRAFIDYYKLHRNATEAAKLAGYSPKTATNQTTRLLNDVDISNAIKSWEAEEREKVAQAIPSKQSFLVQTFIKAKEVNHSPTAAKYWELGARAAGYLEDETQGGSGSVINIICNELKLSSGSPSIIHTLEERKRALINNQSDLINNQVVIEAQGSSESASPRDAQP